MKNILKVAFIFGFVFIGLNSYAGVYYEDNMSLDWKIKKISAKGVATNTNMDGQLVKFDVLPSKKFGFIQLIKNNIKLNDVPSKYTVCIKAKVIKPFKEPLLVTIKDSKNHFIRKPLRFKKIDEIQDLRININDSKLESLDVIIFTVGSSKAMSGEFLIKDFKIMTKE